jgi:hypothetical protein
MRSALAALLVAGLLAPAVAAAQFQPLPPAPPPEPETVAPAPGAEGSGISALQQGFLILAGVVLVVGIGVAITRDARRNAPAEPRPGLGSAPEAAGVGARRKPDPRAAQKQKAAAKRARQARKKNRPTRR